MVANSPATENMFELRYIFHLPQVVSQFEVLRKEQRLDFDVGNHAEQVPGLNLAARPVPSTTMSNVCRREMLMEAPPGKCGCPTGSRTREVAIGRYQPWRLPVYWQSRAANASQCEMRAKPRKRNFSPRIKLCSAVEPAIHG